MNEKVKNILVDLDDNNDHHKEMFQKAHPSNNRRTTSLNWLLKTLLLDPSISSWLRLLGTNDMDFSQLQGISDKKWLPTNRGLCWHAALTPLALFNQVLAILESFIILHSLQTILRWDEPLPVGLLIRQLDCLLNFGRSYLVSRPP